MKFKPIIDVKMKLKLKINIRFIITNKKARVKLKLISETISAQILIQLKLTIPTRKRYQLSKTARKAILKHQET